MGGLFSMPVIQIFSGSLAKFLKLTGSQDVGANGIRPLGVRYIGRSPNAPTILKT